MKGYSEEHSKVLPWGCQGPALSCISTMVIPFQTPQGTQLMHSISTLSSFTVKTNPLLLDSEHSHRSLHDLHSCSWAQIDSICLGYTWSTQVHCSHRASCLCVSVYCILFTAVCGLISCSTSSGQILFLMWYSRCAGRWNTNPSPYPCHCFFQ